MKQRYHEADSNIDTSEVGRTSFVIRVQQNRRGYGDPKAPVKPYDIVRPPFGGRTEMDFRHCTDSVSSSKAKCKLCICRTHVVSFDKIGCMFGQLTQ